MSPGVGGADSRFVLSGTSAPSSLPLPRSSSESSQELLPNLGGPWRTRLLSGLKAVLHPPPQPARKRKTWPPICLAVLDMATAALLLGAGDWIDQTSGLTRMISLGGNHRLVLIIALASFVMLATLASLTEAFAAPSDLQFALIVFSCMVSIVALSGALAILLLAVAALIFVLLPAIVVLVLVVLLGQRRR